MALDFSNLRKKMVLGPEHRQFQLIKPVSNSPIGQVWHAYDLASGEDDESRDKVALEIVNPNLLKNKQTLDEFKTQVTRASHLEHKHLAKILGYFQSREGWLFVAMEPVSTRSLARILIEDGYKQLNAEKARVILHQVAQVLDYIAKQRLSHGDLTPWNVIITHEVGVKLVNVAFRQPLLYQIQQSGSRVLNNEYHAPEAFNINALPTSADIYGFGCLAYLLFGGRAPFSPDTPHSEREPHELDQPKQFSESQWQLLLQALDETPGIRPTSALEMIRQLFPPEQQQLDDKTPLPESNSANEPATSKLKTSTDSSPAPAAKPSIDTAQQPRSGVFLIGSFVAACIMFGAGLVLGYLLAHNEYQKHQLQMTEQIAKVQQLLQTQPSIKSKISLSKEFATLRELDPSPMLLQQLGAKVDDYSVRLTRDAVVPNTPSQTDDAEPCCQPNNRLARSSKMRLSPVCSAPI